MTLLRAILFSFAILWRLVLVFPFLIIGLALFGLIAAILMFLLTFNLIYCWFLVIVTKYWQLLLQLWLLSYLLPIVMAVN